MIRVWLAAAALLLVAVAALYAAGSLAFQDALIVLALAGVGLLTLTAWCAVWLAEDSAQRRERQRP